MTLSIRNPEANALAERLAEFDHTSKTDAVIGALRAALKARLKAETPTQTAVRILAERGITLTETMRQPVDARAYHDLDHDLTGEP